MLLTYELTVLTASVDQEDRGKEEKNGEAAEGCDEDELGVWRERGQTVSLAPETHRWSLAGQVRGARQPGFKTWSCALAGWLRW